MISNNGHADYFHKLYISQFTLTFPFPSTLTFQLSGRQNGGALTKYVKQGSRSTFSCSFAVHSPD